MVFNTHWLIRELSNYHWDRGPWVLIGTNWGVYSTLFSTKLLWNIEDRKPIDKIICRSMLMSPHTHASQNFTNENFHLKDKIARDLKHHNHERFNPLRDKIHWGKNPWKISLRKHGINLPTRNVLNSLRNKILESFHRGNTEQIH